ncbi:hypothetical protein BHE90_016304, partial [Fusarium euwallaceae]
AAIPPPRVQCGDCFVEEENPLSLDCRYHSGERKVDWDGDFWADHDENCHGPIDTEENREDYPEGFFWTCCDRPGDTLGCRRGKHQADRTKSKKYSFSGGFSYADEEDSYDEEADECHKVVPVAVSRHLPPTRESSDASSSGKQDPWGNINQRRKQSRCARLDNRGTDQSESWFIASGTNRTGRRRFNHRGASVLETREVDCENTGKATGNREE